MLVASSFLFTLGRSHDVGDPMPIKKWDEPHWPDLPSHDVMHVEFPYQFNGKKYISYVAWPGDATVEQPDKPGKDGRRMLLGKGASKEKKGKEKTSKTGIKEKKSKKGSKEDEKSKKGSKEDEKSKKGSQEDGVVNELPAAFVAPSWYGLKDYERFRATEFAARGYVAWAFDAYGLGDGMNITTNDQARGNATALRSNPEALWAHMDHVILSVFPMLHELIPGAPKIDTEAVVGTGYCMGGQIVFELARRGTPGVVAVAGFHPSLSALTKPIKQNITAYVQAHHAQYDNAGDQGLLNFEKEMAAANATWATLKYSGVYHGWTDATNDKIYDELQGEVAHDSMRALFKRILAKNGVEVGALAAKRRVQSPHMDGSSLERS
eukprot:g22125.t1